MTNNITNYKRAKVAVSTANHVTKPYTLVLFGASGDLTQRMIMPAIFRLARRGLLSSEFL